MLEALMPARKSYTGGTYHIISSDFISSDRIPTSDYIMSGEEKIKETSTESGKKISREELVVNLVTAIMPEVEEILQRGELDLIKERSAEIGAINAHLNSIDKHLVELNKSFDEAFERFDSIKARFQPQRL